MNKQKLIIKIMEYKGYMGTVDFSNEDQCYFGKIKNIPELVTYVSDFEDTLYLAFMEAVDDYIETKNKIK